MDDIHELLKRQAEWQRGRKTLSWPEKIHMSESIRESVLKFHRTGPRTKARKNKKRDAP